MALLPFARKASGLVLVSLTANFVAACYDHRITQAIMERRRRAKAAEGAKIRAASTVRPQGRLREGRVRFHVSDEYRGQHREWRQALGSLLEASNDILLPSFAVRLDASSMAEWSPKCDPAKLDACLDELARLDPGEDGDWIIGVLGAQPRFTVSFHELGMAHVPGRHIVLRDISDLAEREAIDRAFAAFTPGRRDEIYQRRKQHKRLAVLLHEWGHTLGALHSAENESLLRVSYDDRMAAYDPANQGLIEAGLKDVFRYAGSHQELVTSLQSADDARWVAGERQGLLARLQAAAPQTSAKESAEAVAAGSEATTSAAPDHPFVIEGDEALLLAELSPDHRGAYREVVHMTLHDDALGAWRKLAPLSAHYLSCYAVQHLACGLAMQAGDHAAAQGACTRVSKLTPPGRSGTSP